MKSIRTVELISDEITCFKDGELDPVIQTHPEKSREMIEAALAGPAQIAIGTMMKLRSGNLSAEEFKAGMSQYVLGLRAALRAVYAAYQQGQQARQ